MFVSAVIPAYNEESTVADIVSEVGKVGLVNEIIVISDGSKDRTAIMARMSGARVIELSSNVGKGAAVERGIAEAAGDVILFLDADLIGLKRHHVEKLLEPVLDGRADMTVGLFCSGRTATDLAHRVSPHLSGQRAVKRSVVEGIKNIGVTGYGLEIALTAYADERKLVVEEVELEDMTHVTKEEKYGIVRGFGERLRMYWQIYRGQKLVKK